MTLLFLNSIGGFELIFIILAVLLLFGAESLPGIAKTLGKGMREIRSASNEIKRDIQNSTKDMRDDLNIGNPLNDMKKLIEEPNSSEEFKKDNPETTLRPPETSRPAISDDPITPSDQPQNNDSKA